MRAAVGAEDRHGVLEVGLGHGRYRRDDDQRADQQQEPLFGADPPRPPFHGRDEEVHCRPGGLAVFPPAEQMDQQRRSRSRQPAEHRQAFESEGEKRRGGHGGRGKGLGPETLVLYHNGRPRSTLPWTGKSRTVLITLRRDGISSRRSATRTLDTPALLDSPIPCFEDPTRLVPVGEEGLAAKASSSIARPERASQPLRACTRPAQPVPARARHLQAFPGRAS